MKQKWPGPSQGVLGELGDGEALHWWGWGLVLESHPLWEVMVPWVGGQAVHTGPLCHPLYQLCLRNIIKLTIKKIKTLE